MKDIKYSSLEGFRTSPDRTSLEIGVKRADGRSMVLSIPYKHMYSLIDHAVWCASLCEQKAGQTDASQIPWLPLQESQSLHFENDRAVGLGLKIGSGGLLRILLPYAQARAIAEDLLRQIPDSSRQSPGPVH